MNVMEAKRTLRKLLIRDRQSMLLSARKKMSKKISGHVLRGADLKKSKVVAAFIGFGSEVETYPLIEQLWKKRKTVVVPVTSLGLAKTYFAVFRPGDKLLKTKHGPFEPVRKKKAFGLNQIDLVLVPGLAFDERGCRLGYGGGVYDRLLKKTPRAAHMGLFFSSQGIHRVPTESFDKKMHVIVTEKGIF